MTYPLKWSTDKSTSVTSFKQCYDKKLKPEGSYTSSLSSESKRFFEIKEHLEDTKETKTLDESLYNLISRLEQNYMGCSSICKH